MKDLPNELRISLWTKLTSSGVDKRDLAKSLHKHHAKHVLEVFDIPMGPAGVGVIPNIPNIFQQKDEEKKKWFESLIQFTSTKSGIGFISWSLVPLLSFIRLHVFQMEKFISGKPQKELKLVGSDT